MDIGMLWFDNDAKTDLPAKVSRAATYYEQKYGRIPDLCYVHPSMMSKKKSSSGNIKIKTNPIVLPNHFWIGINSQNGA